MTDGWNELMLGMQDLVETRRIVSGVAVAFGDGTHAVTETLGSAQQVQLHNGAFVPCVRPLTADSVFDLASVTKLFTALCVMLLKDRGRIRLSDPLSRYEPRFTHIGDVTLEELLSFRAGLMTPLRIDAQPDREAALVALFDLRRVPLSPARYYTDMGALALKYVVEAAAGMPFYDFIKQNILVPLGMLDTFARVPDELLPHTVCYNYERRIVSGAYTVDCTCPAGTPHDPKARVLSDGGRDLCGHAALFSTAGDMARLAQGLINDRLFPHETLREIGTNRTGYPLIDGGHTQYLGYLCFTKHPIQTFSEVPACFGPYTLALNGFTGNHFSVDPEQNRFMIILSNRIHNRVTVRTGRPDPTDPVTEMLWDDGRTYPVSQNFTYLKDEKIKDPIARIFAGE